MGRSEVKNPSPEFACRVCYPFVGRDLGGSHVSTLGLIKGLDRLRYEPVVLLQHLDGSIYEYFKSNGVEVSAAPATPDLQRGAPLSLVRQAFLVGSAPRLAKRLREERVKIVHCNDGRSSATWALAGKLAGSRVIWHNRGNPNAAGLKFAAPLLADAVVSVSQFASPRPGFLSAATKNRVVFSPFDVALKEDRASARRMLAAEPGIQDDVAVVGYFGSLVSRKRPLLFVEALARIRASAPDLKVIGLLFGDARDGLDREVEQRADDLGVRDCIRLMGFRTPGSRWIAACDVLMSPGVGEPLGRTLVEAMLVGTPVVATDSGGNPEALRDRQTGLLTPAEDADALAAAVILLIRDHALRREIVSSASRDARTRFGAELHVQAIMQLYDELLAGSSRRPEAIKTEGANSASIARRA